MNEENGTLSFATAIDVSGFDEGAQHMEEKVSEVTANVEQESARMREALSDFPQVNIDFITNASQSLETIDAAFAEINRVVAINKSQIEQLEQSYNQLEKQSGKAFASGADDEAHSIQNDMRATKELIKARKEAIKEAEKTADELLLVEKRLKEEASAVVESEGKSTSLKSRLRELTMQLAELEMQGLANTQEFRDLQNEAAVLQDQLGDTRQQVQILSNDEAGFQGMLSVMSGVSGGFTALTGAMSLFGEENEDLQKVMARLQSVMAITMGLQQVAQTLNKDSAASLVVLNGLKEWWNKLLAIGAGEELAEAAAKTTNSAAAAANATANAAAAAAKEGVAVASGQAAVAEGTQAAATATETTAAVAGTAANITLAGAFRMVAAAIKSIPVIGWVLAGVSALVAIISSLYSATKKADEEFKEQQDILKGARESYLKASVEIENYRKRIEGFNGTQAEEKKLVEELNQKYGVSMGYHKSLSAWKDTLKQKGAAYCEVIMLEAQAQAVLNKYTEAYVNLLEVKDKAEKGEYDHWYNTRRGDEISRQNAINEAQAEMDRWKSQYDQIQEQIKGVKNTYQLNDHVSPSTSSRSTGSSGGTAFDAKKAALDSKKAIDDWKKSVKEYLKDANDEVINYSIERMVDGQAKEINQITYNVFNQKRQWEQKLRELAETRKNALKDVYMTGKGATEVGWSNSEGGKKSIDDYMKELLADQEISKQYYAVLESITEEGERKIRAVRQKYTDALVDEFGNTQQKLEKLQREWTEKIAFVPSEFLDKAIDQMEQEFSALETADFKKSIDWDSVFGSLDKQSTDSIEFALERVKKYFDDTRESMSTEDIKNFSEAIKKMEDEIASRNPFSAFAKSIKDITTYKSELVSSLKEMAQAQAELTAAQNEYNDAKQALNDLQSQVNDGTLAENSEKYAAAQERLKTAKIALTSATEKSNKSERNAMNARNHITSAYKNFATQLKSVGGVISGLGDKAKNLASIFSANVANGIGKALDVIDSVTEAASDCINALSDTGKSVSQTMVSTAQASGTAMQGTAKATSTAISSVEKASVILAVISAALQVATTIASLFNNDDELQEDIDRLQNEIDQLQWQLDNLEVVELEKTMGNTFENISAIIAQTRQEIYQTQVVAKGYANTWRGAMIMLSNESEIYAKAVQKIADAYASASYTADKFLGSEKWDSARSQLENYAEQMTLIRRQIDDEYDKKDSDESAIISYKQNLSEIAEKMASLVNDMIEGIIGGSAADIATQLGDAFFEACKNGEDAMQAWASTAKDIIRDVVKQMLVSKFLEEPLGKIFDKYKTRWFGSDGRFAGIDAVIDSMQGFSNDLNAVGQNFTQVWSNLPDNITEWFSTDERSGTSSGIATASQESVDENNARLTTIQAHTYTLVQGVQELNSTGTLVLARLTGIEQNTNNSANSLADVRSHVRSMRNTLDEIQLKGIKIS